MQCMHCLEEQCCFWMFMCLHGGCWCAPIADTGMGPGDDGCGWLLPQNSHTYCLLVVVDCELYNSAVIMMFSPSKVEPCSFDDLIRCSAIHNRLAWLIVH